MAMIVLIRGGGDLASGVALRLYRAGFRVAISELAQPMAIRRRVAFAEAVYGGETTIEGITGKLVKDPTDTLRIIQIFAKNYIPVMIDPQAEAVNTLHPTVVVDARMLKKHAELLPKTIQLILGLGPGFAAGENCHAVIETRRGHTLGRVIWEGSAISDTGLPEHVDKWSAERVLRAPISGVLEAKAEIGDHLEQGQTIAVISGEYIKAPFTGILRGLIHPGLTIEQGCKIGDIDPRDDPQLCNLISDKALAIGGGVLEAILSRPNLRPHIWQ
jgi:xanthine dehydrogenase accessory factor